MNLLPTGLLLSAPARIAILSGVLGAILATAASAQVSQPRDSSVLPLPEPPFEGTIGRTYKESEPRGLSFRPRLRAHPTSSSSCSTTWASASPPPSVG
jgi:hypothetical protein